MFSPVRLEPVVPDLRGLSLGPIAVLPAFQGRGIGRRLVEAGLTEARHRGLDFVMLLGSPELYPRFGFRPGVEFGLRSNFDVPALDTRTWELTIDGAVHTPRSFTLAQLQELGARDIAVTLPRPPAMSPLSLSRPLTLRTSSSMSVHGPS